MGQSRHHYERAIEAHLRDRKIPFISVNEVRRTVLPPDADMRVRDLSPQRTPGEGHETDKKRLIKSFDHVIYGEPTNLLVDIKGRKVKGGKGPTSAGRLESWVTEDDIKALREWESLFGEGFRAAFVFVYWCETQPPDALFQEIFEHHERWYAVRSVLLDDYVREMTPRSRKWRTVNIPTARFEAISQPLTASPAAEFRRPRGGWRAGEMNDACDPRFAPTLAAR